MKTLRFLVIGLALFFIGNHSQITVLAQTNQEKPSDMVLIPAGPFWMGIDELPPDTPWGQKDAKPKHQVTLPAFYIDRYEVTYGNYLRVDPSLKIPDRTDDTPMTHVTWHDADHYCRSVGKRLPTEAEWEKAARGTDGRAYPWGNKFDLKKTNTGNTLKPVGSYPEDQSPYGVYDMAGNVSEWTDSWYRAYPGNTFESEDYGIFQKVVRGGSFNVNRHFADDMFAQATFRNYNRPDAIGPDNGFRCAKSVSSGGKR
ncbi:MAG: formylglycine-generating enzyme family protein [Nitrospiria bacterium]